MRSEWEAEMAYSAELSDGPRQFAMGVLASAPRLALATVDHDRYLRLRSIGAILALAAPITLTAELARRSGDRMLAVGLVLLVAAMAGAGGITWSGSDRAIVVANRAASLMAAGGVALVLGNGSMYPSSFDAHFAGTVALWSLIIGLSMAYLVLLVGSSRVAVLTAATAAIASLLIFAVSALANLALALAPPTAERLSYITFALTAMLAACALTLLAGTNRRV